MISRRLLLGGLLAIGAIAVLGVAVQRRTDAATNTASAPRSPHAAGRILYVDPETGERTAPPPAVAAREGARRRLDVGWSDAGLVEEPLPGGGVRVDLQGRFQTVRRKIVRPDGTVEYACEHAAGSHEVAR